MERGMVFPNGMRLPKALSVTPSSCSSYRHIMTPGTPDPLRSDLKTIVGDVGAVLFDFDGTLTASPGETAQRCRKKLELHERAPLLAPRLRALRDAGLTLGIISKSSELTIRVALREAGLMEFFDGPLLGKAVGLEGKAGFIEELVVAGDLNHLGKEGLRRVLLVDDDVYELDRARARGIQVYAAPGEGGLQDDDFEEIFTGLGLPPTPSQAPASGRNSTGSGVSSALPSPVGASCVGVAAPRSPLGSVSSGVLSPTLGMPSGRPSPQCPRSRAASPGSAPCSVATTPLPPLAPRRGSLRSRPSSEGARPSPQRSRTHPELLLGVERGAWA